MPATTLKRRFDRSKIAPLKAERSEGLQGLDNLKLVERQNLPGDNPPPPPPEDPLSSDEDDSEDDGASETSGEEDDVEPLNPFDPRTSTTSQDQASITGPSSTSSTSSVPRVAHVTTSRSASSSPSTSTEIAPITSQGLLSSTSDLVGSFTTIPTSTVPLPDTSSGLPSTTSVNPAAASETVRAQDHPVAKVAIILPSLLAGVVAIAAIYLLMRYCTPLKARWAVFRARKGRRLPGEEEDGRLSGVAPQMSEAYATRTEAARPSSLHIDPTAATPAPLLARSLSRTQTMHDKTAQPPAYTASGLGPHASQLHVEDHAGLRNPIARLSHPNGLANNPPTPVARKHPPLPSQVHIPVNPVPNLPSPISVDGRVSMGFPLPPTIPSTPHFPAPSPLESTFSSPRRPRKSVTPSESISNVPDSPFPFSPALMPPMPVWNSRWSHNSSSVNGRPPPSDEGSAQPQDSSGPGPAVESVSPVSRSPSLKSTRSSAVSPS
ncbi:hypothetical protein AYO21_08148 [Fonsecaea monophora]|uniref:Uncharacterized protein n=1 Tax=Fonsecaea monophora TaxID=254056 RepID=A0A177F024_9EURO|nr:hypothetical protein AYO21_08148 [Fonsecaea monophora]KAH0837195.1 hypothetical protein FOPE_04685 [Fonsecaea pedrosoi]OAG37664.1 hypothetical protein AYO21_08148 [Fonsecaea monophora]